MIPELKKKYAITDDRAGHAICGMSSGGICAFTRAWHRPEFFSEGRQPLRQLHRHPCGHAYTTLIRKTEPKPLPRLPPSGTNDNDNDHGNWPLANQEMASSLKYKKYDYRFRVRRRDALAQARGEHFPDTMRWIWRDYPGVAATTP
jgi:enterochelin esterase family protein